MSAIVLKKIPNGYPRLAVFTASDQLMRQYRRFRTVHTRIVAYSQTDLQHLENGLDAFDLLYAGERRLRSWRVDAVKCPRENADNHRTRREILEDLQVKVCQCG